MFTTHSMSSRYHHTDNFILISFVLFVLLQKIDLSESVVCLSPRGCDTDTLTISACSIYEYDTTQVNSDIGWTDRLSVAASGASNVASSSSWLHFLEQKLQSLPYLSQFNEMYNGNNKTEYSLCKQNEQQRRIILESGSRSTLSSLLSPGSLSLSPNPSQNPSRSPSSGPINSLNTPLNTPFNSPNTLSQLSDISPSSQNSIQASVSGTIVGDLPPGDILFMYPSSTYSNSTDNVVYFSGKILYFHDFFTVYFLVLPLFSVFDCPFVCL